MDENKDEFNNKKLMDELEGLEDYGKNEEIKKQKHKENIIIIIVLLILAIGLGVYYLKENPNIITKDTITENEFIEDFKGLDDESFYYEDELENSYYEEEIQLAKFLEKKNNILVEEPTISINKELIFKISNKNSEDIDFIDIYVVFFDANNAVIDVEYDTIEYIKANSDTYLKLDERKDAYARCEVIVKKEVFFYPEELNQYRNEVVEINSEKVGDKIKVDIKNTGEENLELIEATVVYYDEQHNIIDVLEIYEDMVEQDQVKTTYVPANFYDTELKKVVNSTDYEIIVDYAYIDTEY